MQILRRGSASARTCLPVGRTNDEPESRGHRPLAQGNRRELCHITGETHPPPDVTVEVGAVTI